MNKSEVINQIVIKTGNSQAAVNRLLNAFFSTIKDSLKNENTVTLIGFGTFSTSIRTARMGRNPRTGEIIKIRESKILRFRPGKALKDALD